MTKHTALLMEYERGFRDAGNEPGDHYTIDDDFLTIYMGEDAIENFDPEKHDWAEVYGPNQEANARFIVTACNCHADLLEACRGMMALLKSIPFDEIPDFPAYPNWKRWEQAIRKVEESSK